jgi:hypothetical protein
VEKIGDEPTMKRWVVLLFISITLFGDTLRVDVIFKGEPTLGIRMLQQSFNTVGYKLEIDHIRTEDETRLGGKAIGSKGFNINALYESLKSMGIHIDNGELKPKLLLLNLDLHRNISVFPILERDDGVELKRVNGPQWFRVAEVALIRIQAPYVGKWYPEIAVFDANFELLSSVRSLEPKIEVEFKLPANARYLKISNLQGMKVLKEGMWIESVGSEQ